MKELNKAPLIFKELFKGINKINLQTKLPEILFNKNSTSDKNCNLSKNNLSSVLNKLIKCSTSKKKASLEDFYYHDEDGSIFKLDQSGRVIKEVANHLDHDVESPRRLNKADNDQGIKQPASQGTKPQSNPNPKAGKEKHPLHDFLKKMPNSNWKDWVKSNYDNNPKSFTEDVKSSLEHYSGMTHIPDVANTRFTSSHSFKEGIDILREAEKQYIERTKNKKNFAELPSTAKKVLDFGDGMAWWDLRKPYCENEGMAMGHCGNKASHKPYHTILSLRKEYNLDGKKYYEPHLTFVLDKEYGALGEMKGRANEKPSPKYHRYIKELLKQPFIKMIKGGGYRPENNFCFSDLALEYQKEVLDVNPDLVYDDVSQDNLYKILMLPEEYRHAEWRCHAAKNIDLSKIDSTTIESLINSDFNISYNLCLNSTLPLHLVEHLAVYPDYAVRSIIAERPNLPSYLIEKLATDEDPHVRSEVAKRQDIEPIMVEKYANDEDCTVRNSVAERPDLPDHLVEKLANDNDWKVRRSVAARPGLPDHLVEKLANDNDWEVRRIIAERSGLPDHLVEKLANDEHWFVRCIIAGKPGLPEHLVEKLANDEHWTVCESIAKQQNMTLKAMEILSQSGSCSIFLSLASNPRLPSHLIESIAARSKNFKPDEAKQIHQRLASHPNTPAHLLEQYADEHDVTLHENLAKNPNLPADIAENLLNDNQHRVIWNLSENPNLPDYIAERLATNPRYSFAHENLASNRNLSPHIFKILETSERDTVKVVLENNPSYIQWKQEQKL